jgi:hypothetical protein
MKNVSVLILFFTFLASSGFSRQIFPLYEGRAPGFEDLNYKEIDWSSPLMTGRMIRNVVDPTLEVYIPDKSLATGTSVIICPGGGNIWHFVVLVDLVL